MRDANDADFANFLSWYSQAGTPVVKVNTSYNAEGHTFSLKISQETPPTPGQSFKEPTLIPIAVGLLDSNGKDIPLSSIYHNGALQPVSSTNDSDEFNRWEAGQILARKLMLNLVDDFQNNKPLVLNSNFVGGFKRILTDSSLDKEFMAKAITLSGEGEIMDLMEATDPDVVHTVRSFIRKQLASELKSEFLSTVENNKSSGEYVFDHSNMSRRALKNVALAYLASPEDQKFTDLAL
ncbi:hypothetical protein RYX36_032023 [Vicia faba]